MGDAVMGVGLFGLNSKLRYYNGDWRLRVDSLMGSGNFGVTLFDALNVDCACDGRAPVLMAVR